MTFFSDLTNLLLNGMGSNLFHQSGNLIAGIAPIFQIGFGIYILLVAFNYYNKGVDGSIIDLTKSSIGWLIVIACAFNAGQYARIADFAWNLPEGLSGLLGNSEFDASALDVIFDKFLDTVAEIYEISAELGWTEISDKVAIVVALPVIIVCFTVLFAVIVAFYMVAKLSLAMVIVIGPIFIGAMLFPATRQWGMNWIGQILNYSVTITFFTILASLALDFYKSHIQTALVTGVGIEGTGWAAILFSALPYYLLGTLVFIIVSWNIPSIASALTGGAGANGFSRTLANMARMSKGMPPLPPGGGGSKGGGSIGKG